MPDAAALRAVADWTMPTSGMTPLQGLSREFTGDTWAQGRYLAGILSVWIDDLRAEATRGGARRAPKQAEQHKELGRYLSDGTRDNIITTVRETSARIAVRLELPEGTILAANGMARDVTRDKFRLGVFTDDPDGGASVWVRFPSANEISRIAHYELGYRVHLPNKLVLTIARRLPA